MTDYDYTIAILIYCKLELFYFSILFLHIINNQLARNIYYIIFQKMIYL